MQHRLSSPDYAWASPPAFIGVILAELLITPTGVGDLITFYRSRAQYSEMYAAVFTVIAFSAVVVGLLEVAETRYFRPEKRKSR